MGDALGKALWAVFLVICFMALHWAASHYDWDDFV